VRANTFWLISALLAAQACNCDKKPVVTGDGGGEVDMTSAEIDMTVVITEDLAGVDIAGADLSCLATSCGAPLGCACTVGTDCCSGNCDSGKCVPMGCKAQGLDCTADGECCTLFCSNLKCAIRTPPCSGTGSPCATGDNCCSGNCATQAGSACGDGGTGCVCGTSSGCKAAGEACTTDPMCCNGICDNPDGGAGSCAVLTGCKSAGEPCGTEGYNGSCCSTVCLDTGSGTPHCVFLGGCRVQDELCKTDGECCSKKCSQQGTTLDGTPIKRCANASSCLPAGEVCGGQGASSNCCPNGGGDTGCEPTGGGFRRCFGGENTTCTLPGQVCVNETECCNDPYPNLVCMPRTGTTMPTVCCLADGQLCAFGDVCCSGVCTPAMDGMLRCGAMSCVMSGGNCTTDGDCCAGNCCRDNGAGVLQCTTSCGTACTLGQLGDPCTADADCCNSPPNGPVQCVGSVEFRACGLP
jgi:hypothetical protein